MTVEDQKSNFFCSSSYRPLFIVVCSDYLPTLSTLLSVEREDVCQQLRTSGPQPLQTDILHERLVYRFYFREELLSLEWQSKGLLGQV